MLLQQALKISQSFEAKIFLDTESKLYLLNKFVSMTGELPVKHQKLINYGQKKGKNQWAVSKNKKKQKNKL